MRRINEARMLGYLYRQRFSCIKFSSCLRIIELKNVGKFLYKTTFKLENQVKKKCANLDKAVEEAL
jgi:hypothetical protein